MIIRNIRAVQTGLNVGLILVAIALLSPVSADYGIDLHWLWDDRCTSCHGHSAEFARKFLSVSGDKLQGRHHVDDLRLFLENHYLAGQFVDDVYVMLIAQTRHQARFKNECSRCHQNAASMVREKLFFRDNILSLRKSGKSVREFLEGHRRLNDQEVKFYTALLIRVAKEANLSEN